MSAKNSLKTLKSLLLLVESHKLDELEFNGIKVKKSKHTVEHQKIPAKDTSQSKNTPNKLPTSIEEIDRMNRVAMGLSN